MLGSVEKKKRECCSIVKSVLLFPDVQHSNHPLPTIEFKKKKKKLFNRQFYFCKIVPKEWISSNKWGSVKHHTQKVIRVQLQPLPGMFLVVILPFHQPTISNTSKFQPNFSQNTPKFPIHLS